MNALALFWVTDSVSERSAVTPPSGTNAVMDHPVYEMSSERATHHKDPGASIGQAISNHRQSRQSWLPLMAVDRGLRMLFVRDRETAPRETGTIDVEVSFWFDWSHAQLPRSRISDRNPH